MRWGILVPPRHPGAGGSEPKAIAFVPVAAGLHFAGRRRVVHDGPVDGPTSNRPAAREELNALLRGVVARDAGALKGVYDRTVGKLYGICLQLLRDEAEAEDVLQEVYVTVWNRAASFDPSRASPITWLATLARNRAIDRLRSRRDPGEALSAASGIADDGLSSLEILEQAEDSLRLQRCMDELEEKARSWIRAAFFQGATYPELAERERVPLPTVKSKVRRSLLRLRGCLER